MAEIRMIDIPDELTYRSYVFNRQQFPKVEPERWAKIYPGAEKMEARFKQEHYTRVEK